MKYTFYLLALVFLISACKDAAKTVDTATETAKEVVKEVAADMSKEQSLGGGITMKPFTSSVQFPDAAISTMNYTNGVFTFGIRGESYSLGQQSTDVESKMCANSGKGQHIHLIVDNAPYAAKYVNQFTHDVSDGDHHVLAFLSRSYHESIKTENAHIAVKVNVKDKSITSTERITEPMLFYSRPKGTYVGNDTKNLMLDFFVKNVDLSANGYKVKANINGTETIISKWQPYYLNGLPMGENTIELTLIDKDGNAVATPLNPVSRTFTLKADPLG